MTAMWFGLAAIALVGAVALLYIDRMQRQRSGRVREMWAKAQGFGFEASNPTLASTWHRAALTGQEYLTAVDIVTGTRRGENFLLFDLEDTATIVAVEREIGSDVDIDLRRKSAPPPKDHDLEVVGAMGDCVVFATDGAIARRVCDSRMSVFTQNLPERLQTLWSENRWTLGSMPLATSARDWDEAIDAVTRLSGILHALPPAREPSGLSRSVHDPGHPRPADTPPPGEGRRPRPEAEAGSAPGRVDPSRAAARVLPPPRPVEPRATEPHPAEPPPLPQRRAWRSDPEHGVPPSDSFGGQFPARFRGHPGPVQ